MFKFEGSLPKVFYFHCKDEDYKIVYKAKVIGFKVFVKWRDENGKRQANTFSLDSAETSFAIGTWEMIENPQKPKKIKEYRVFYRNTALKINKSVAFNTKKKALDFIKNAQPLIEIDIQKLKKITTTELDWSAE